MAKLPVNLQAKEFVLRGREMNEFYKNLQYWNQVNRTLKDMYESGDYSDQDITNLKTSYLIYEQIQTIVDAFDKAAKNDIKIPFQYRDKLFRIIETLNADLEPYKHQQQVMELGEMVSPWLNENLK